MMRSPDLALALLSRAAQTLQSTMFTHFALGVHIEQTDEGLYFLIAQPESEPAGCGVVLSYVGVVWVLHTIDGRTTLATGTTPDEAVRLCPHPLLLNALVGLPPPAAMAGCNDTSPPSEHLLKHS